MSLSAIIRREVFQKNMSSPWSIIFMAMVAIGNAFLIFKGYYLVPIFLIAGIIGAIIFYYCFFKPYTGFYIVTFIAFFAFYPSHLLNKDIPLSTLVEVLIWVIFLGSMRQKTSETAQNKLFRSPVSIIFLIYFGYYVVQFFNPELSVKSGYLFFIRKFLMFVAIYIIGYRLVDTPQKFRQYLKFWLVMSIIGAMYGCYQQWFGYLPQELQFLQSNPVEFKLLNQGGQLRKISFFDGVVTFGVLSGSMCVITIILAIHFKEKRKRWLLILGSVFLALGMSYTGTRTTTVIIPIGISLYIIMTVREKRTLITIFMSMLAILTVLYAPIYGNKTLNRMRSTFQSDEPSLEVRDYKRKLMQPYIYAHPLGGGVATTGNQSKRFNPNHPLAGFMPDSGFFQIALEIGYVGFGLTILWYLFILYQCIYIAFRLKNPEYKTYAIAISCCLLSIMVTQYAQASVGQLPSIIFFMSVISIILRLREFDRSENIIENKYSD